VAVADSLARMRQQGSAVADNDRLSERTEVILLEQFIAVLGQDLRNPLASICASTRVLRRPNGRMEEDDREIPGLQGSVP